MLRVIWYSIIKSLLIGMKGLSMNLPEFDRVYHLLGEQSIPVFICIKIFGDCEHVLYVTSKTEKTVKNIQDALGNEANRLVVVKVDPYNIDSLNQVFKDETRKHQTKKLGFDCTGGTKPMFAALLNQCQEIKGTAFYLNSAQRKLDFLFPEYKSVPLVPVFSSVHEFIKLAGFKVKETSPRKNRQERSELTDFCWKNKVLLSKIQFKISAFNNAPGKPFFIENTKSKRYISARLEKEGKATITADGKKLSFDDFPDFARFLSGEWLEEYVYKLLLPLNADNQIRDIHINMCPQWSTHNELVSTSNRRKNTIAQEFDVTFTDGYDLFILECKAGGIKQEHVQKLENLVRTFGGSFGKGIFAASGNQSKQIQNRLKNSKSVSSFIGDSVKRIPESFSSLEAGKIFAFNRSSGGTNFLQKRK